MAIDTPAPSSRRALLAAALGGVGATVFHALGRPAPAAAADGDPIAAGQTTTETARTTLVQQTNDDGFEVYGGANFTGTAIRGVADMGIGLEGIGGIVGARLRNMNNGTGLLAISGADVVAPAAKIGVYGYANQDVNARAIYGKSLLGTGVWGNSDTGRGLFGRSTSGTGVSAQSDTGRAVYGTTGASDKTALLGQNTSGNASGIQGFSGGSTPPIPDAQTGVQGNSNISTAANGVLGRSTIGTGVWGDTTNGFGVAGTGGNDSLGVYAAGGVGLYATGGVALISDGPALFSTSGKVTIASGSSATVTVPGGLVAESIGLAVLQTNRAGVWVRAVTSNVAGSTITIYLNTAVAASTTIGWFVIN